MPGNIPTTKQIRDANLAKYEALLGQDSPIQDKAFLKVQAVINALNTTPIYKFAAERIVQNLATSATGDDLAAIGKEYGVNKILETPARLEITLNAQVGIVVGPPRTYVGNLNGIRYNIDAQGAEAGGVIVLNITAQTAGDIGNLNIGNELTIDSNVPGAESTALVSAIIELGVPEEDQEVYRAKVLDAIRAGGGGGNSSDFRIWAQQTPGVKRAYPFSALPESVVAESAPPDRTVYIEAVETIDPDGIAPPALLDLARETIITDPETGRERQSLGITNEHLYVVSITRREFYVEIRGLNTAPEKEAQLKSDIEDALELYFLSLSTFVQGLDPDFEKRDLITDLSISDVIQDVLDAAGSSALAVGFGLNVGEFLGSYQLAPGELAKLIQLDFAQ